MITSLASTKRRTAAIRHTSPPRDNSLNESARPKNPITHALSVVPIFESPRCPKLPVSNQLSKQRLSMGSSSPTPRPDPGQSRGMKHRSPALGSAEVSSNLDQRISQVMPTATCRLRYSGSSPRLGAESAPKPSFGTTQPPTRHEHHRAASACPVPPQPPGPKS